MVKRDFRKDPITQDEVLNCYWYPVVDNLIGGWSISNVDMTTADLNPYEGQFEFGSFMTEYEAKHIADIHNAWWDAVVWGSYYENIELSIYKDYLPELTEDDWFEYDTDHEEA